MSQREVSNIRARNRRGQLSERSDSRGLTSRCVARLCLVALFAAASVIPPFGTAEANNGKGPKMPAPTAVFKDADGKTIAQLVGFWTVGTFLDPLALMNFDGDLALVQVGPRFLRSLLAGNPQFTGVDCTGQVYLGKQWSGTLADMTKDFVSIVGPDRETGEYRVFKATSSTPESTTIASSMSYQYGVCTNRDEPSVGAILYPAVEILPNPLAEFHGPTAEHPERTLTIEGGTRY